MLLKLFTNAMQATGLDTDPSLLPREKYQAYKTMLSAWWKSNPPSTQGTVDTANESELQELCSYLVTGNKYNGRQLKENLVAVHTLLLDVEPTEQYPNPPDLVTFLKSLPFKAVGTPSLSGYDPTLPATQRCYKYHVFVPLAQPVDRAIAEQALSSLKERYEFLDKNVRLDHYFIPPLPVNATQGRKDFVMCHCGLNNEELPYYTPATHATSESTHTHDTHAPSHYDHNKLYDCMKLLLKNKVGTIDSEVTGPRGGKRIGKKPILTQGFRHTTLLSIVSLFTDNGKLDYDLDLLKASLCKDPLNGAIWTEFFTDPVELRNYYNKCGLDHNARHNPEDENKLRKAYDLMYNMLLDHLTNDQFGGFIHSKVKWSQDHFTQTMANCEVVSQFEPFKCYLIKAENNLAVISASGAKLYPMLKTQRDITNDFILWYLDAIKQTHEVGVMLDVAEDKYSVVAARRDCSEALEYHFIADNPEAVAVPILVANFENMKPTDIEPSIPIELDALCIQHVINRLNRLETATWQGESLTEDNRLLWGLPIIDTITNAPFLNKECEPKYELGVHEKERVILISERKPTELTLDEARANVTKWLKHWKFADTQSERRAAMLMATGAILNNTMSKPMFLIQAAQASSGKTFLAEYSSYLWDLDNDMFAFGTQTDEEVKKKIDASIAADKRMVIVDNLPSNRSLDNTVYEVYCTAERGLSIRVLGRSQVVKVPNKFVIVATGNNVFATADMVSRVIPIELGDLITDEEQSSYGRDIATDYLKENKYMIQDSIFKLFKEGYEASRPVKSRFRDYAKYILGFLEALYPDVLVEELEALLPSMKQGEDPENNDYGTRTRQVFDAIAELIYSKVEQGATFQRYLTTRGAKAYKEQVVNGMVTGEEIYEYIMKSNMFQGVFSLRYEKNEEVVAKMLHSILKDRTRRFGYRLLYATVTVDRIDGKGKTTKNHYFLERISGTKDELFRYNCLESDAVKENVTLTPLMLSEDEGEENE